MSDQKTVLEEVFGGSSDSDTEDDEQQQHLEEDLFPSDEDGSQSNVSQKSSWQWFEEIRGLCLCRDFLSPEEQSYLLSAIQNEGWFTDTSHNQVMRFGDLPMWATKLSDSIREEVLLSDDLPINDGDKDVCILPSDLLWREPLFDQLIVNVYQPGEGICPHVDLMRFEDGIAIVSLESSCVMHFAQVKEASATGEGRIDNPHAVKIPVYLTPGSLVIMSREARYLWKHEINRKQGFQVWEGEELNQKKRTSITLRKLCHVE